VLHWASVLAEAPRKLTTAAVLMPGGPAALLAVTAVVADDDLDAVRAALKPLLAGRPRPLRASATVVPYTALVPRAHLHPNVGQQPVATTSALFRQITPEVARGLTAATRDAGVFVQLRSVGGAANDMPAEATAYAHRRHQVLATGTLFPPGTEEELARRWAPVRSNADGAYVNFETRTDVDVFTRAYPGPTGDRVAAAWRRYDPDGLLQPIDTPDRPGPR
jgi:hypothetical protein